MPSGELKRFDLVQLSISIDIKSKQILQI